MKRTKITPRKRDYSVEYQARLRRAHLAGLSKAQARGHARDKGERPVKAAPRVKRGGARAKKRAAWYQQTVAEFVGYMTGRGLTRHDAYTLWFSP